MSVRIFIISSSNLFMYQLLVYQVFVYYWFLHLNKRVIVMRQGGSKEVHFLFKMQSKPQKENVPATSSMKRQQKQKCLIAIMSYLENMSSLIPEMSGIFSY